MPEKKRNPPDIPSPREEESLSENARITNIVNELVSDSSLCRHSNWIGYSYNFQCHLSS